MTLEAVDRMSRSADASDRVRAARIVAGHDAAQGDAIVLRLLSDPVDLAVTEAMVVALLAERREAALPLILCGLGQAQLDGPVRPELRGGAVQIMLEGLLNSELDGVDVRPSIASVLVQSDDWRELVGALEAIVWLAPSGGFPAPPAALERVNRLAARSDDPMRVLAHQAVAALAAHWRPPETPEEPG